MAFEKYIKKVPAFRDELHLSTHDRLVEHGWSSHDDGKLFELAADDRFIIRKADADMFLEGQQSSPLETGKKVKALFDELAAKYDIIAPVHFTVAKDENQNDSLYIITDKVRAVDVDALDDIERSAAISEITSIHGSILRYLKDKAKNGEDFLQDIPDARQYVYGHIDGENKNHWYMVDVDPFYSSGHEAVADSLDVFRDELEDLESKYTISLTALREECEQLLDELASSADDSSD